MLSSCLVKNGLLRILDDLESAWSHGNVIKHCHVYMMAWLCFAWSVWWNETKERATRRKERWGKNVKLWNGKKWRKLTFSVSFPSGSQKNGPFGAQGSQRVKKLGDKFNYWNWIIFSWVVWRDFLVNRKSRQRPRFHTFYSNSLIKPYLNVCKNLICILQFWRIAYYRYVFYEFLVREMFLYRSEHHSFQWKKRKLQKNCHYFCLSTVRVRCKNK